MIVCQCGVVSDRQVTTAIEAGERSLARLCRSTGAGQNCGVCVFSLKRLLCEHGNPVPAHPSPEVEVAAC